MVLRHRRHGISPRRIRRRSLPLERGSQRGRVPGGSWQRGAAHGKSLVRWGPRRRYWILFGQRRAGQIGPRSQTRGIHTESDPVDFDFFFFTGWRRDHGRPALLDGATAAFGGRLRCRWLPPHRDAPTDDWCIHPSAIVVRRVFGRQSQAEEASSSIVFGRGRGWRWTIIKIGIAVNGSANCDFSVGE